MAFAQAHKAGTSAAYAEYLSSYPQGRHAEEAQRMRELAKAREDADDAAYAKAHKAGTSEAYAEYVSSYRKGRHNEQARRMKAQAKAREDATMRPMRRRARRVRRRHMPSTSLHTRRVATPKKARRRV